MQRRDQWIGGAVLIVIGSALLLGRLIADAGQFVTLGIGLLLLVLFAVSRNPGTLIGGGIVTGIGAGVLVNMNTQGTIAESAVLFGLGLGFISVWLIGTLMRIRGISVWPLVPGTILVVIGAVVLGGPEAAKTFETAWPVLLIGLGIIVLIAALRGHGPGPVGSTPA